MVDFFVEMAQVARELVEESGRSVTLYRKNSTPAASSTPWRGPDAPPATSDGGDQVEAIVCFVPPAGSGLGRDMAEMLGQSTTNIDQVGLLAADSVADVDIEAFDTVVDGSRSWNIDRVARLQPGDTCLLWVLMLKAGGP